MADAFRLRALQRTAMAAHAPPGVRLLSTRAHTSSYAGIDDYTADVKDAPDPSSYERVYRIDASVPEVTSEFQRRAAQDGWRLVGAGCGVDSQAATPQAQRNSRQYERRLLGFVATLRLTLTTSASAIFPGTVISDMRVLLQAPAVLAAGSSGPVPRIDQACLGRPGATSPPPTAMGACEAADRKLAVVVPGGAVPLMARPLPMSSRASDRRPMRVAPSDDDTCFAAPPLEPRSLLRRHAAMNGYQAHVPASRETGSDGGRDATYAYQFATHEAARAFHVDAVGRACGQALESFDVSGVPDAVGFRLYVTAAGPDCLVRSDLVWGLADGSGPQCDNWVVDYVAFVRGQYHLSVVVGDPDQTPIDLPAQRRAAISMIVAVSQLACRNADDPRRVNACG